MRHFEEMEIMAYDAIIQTRKGTISQENRISKRHANYQLFVDGQDSVLSLAFNLSEHGALKSDTIGLLEEIFKKYHCSTSVHEISSLSHPSTAHLLMAAGYCKVDEYMVLFHKKNSLKNEPTIDHNLSVRVIKDHEKDFWAYLTALAWKAEDQSMYRFHLQLGKDWARTPQMICFIAELGLLPIATASVYMHEDIGFLMQGGTLPEYRNLGAHKALILARRAHCYANGCSSTMIAARPYSLSWRNADKLGYSPAYLRFKWFKPL